MVKNIVKVLFFLLASQGLFAASTNSNISLNAYPVGQEFYELEEGSDVFIYGYLKSDGSNYFLYKNLDALSVINEFYADLFRIQLWYPPGKIALNCLQKFVIVNGTKIHALGLPALDKISFIERLDVGSDELCTPEGIEGLPINYFEQM